MTAGRVARLAAAVCAMLAAPAAGQDSLRDGLDRMARDIALLLEEEADRTGDRIEVRFRPARTGPQQIGVYCGPLSFGLRNALHEGVQRRRGNLNSRFDVVVADERAHEPPDVTMSWTWGGAESIDVETHVWLPGGRSQRYSATLDVAGLNGAQRECLFTFRPGGGVTEAREAGFLHEEPTFDVRRIVHRFAAGDKLDVLGVLSPEDGNGAVWSVVVWDDPETRTWRTLFTTGLADRKTRDAVGGADPDPVEPDPSDPEYEVGDVFRDCPYCPEMVVVPYNAFIIGSPFAVGVYEVTFEEWDACVSSGGCGGYRPDDKGWGRGRRPVINVSWDDAQAYVEWLSRETGASYRLPSESEWEYAARAGTTTRYWWGDDIGRNRAVCNGCGSRWDVKSTAPVGSFDANAFGLHDVHGNVTEWVEDCWNGNCSRRVLRGGSWLDGPRGLRSALRYLDDSGVRNIVNGFRVARTLTP